MIDLDAIQERLEAGGPVDKHSSTARQDVAALLAVVRAVKEETAAAEYIASTHDLSSVQNQYRFWASRLRKTLEATPADLPQPNPLVYQCPACDSKNCSPGNYDPVAQAIAEVDIITCADCGENWDVYENTADVVG